MTVAFRLAGQDYIALNGGPDFSFTPAISFYVRCEDQDEIDRLWDALTDGGEEQPCGWLVDRFGLSWQIVPAELDQLIGGGDAERSRRVLEALWKMQKIEIQPLRDAAAAG
jgi:predicted 3-demethylubiquinone-9 3-methyltransferase (glyoxalase superfamily)